MKKSDVAACLTADGFIGAMFAAIVYVLTWVLFHDRGLAFGASAATFLIMFTALAFVQGAHTPDAPIPDETRERAHG